MRCSRLAKFFKKKGHKSFIFIDKKNFLLKKLYKPIEIYKKNEKFYNQKNDAFRFIEKIKYLPLGYVIVDDYRLGSYWEKKLKSYCIKIISIDDFENRKHYTDIYINQKTKFLINEKLNTKILLKKNTKCLIGPKYSIINKSIKKKKNKRFTIIFNFGGSGNLKYCYNILKKLVKNNGFKFRCIVIIGLLSKNKHLIYKLKQKNKNIIPLANKIDLSKIYSNSHLFIGSAGTSVYETSYNKLLSVLFQISKNQSNSIKALEKIGHYFLLEFKDLSFPKKISKLILNLFYNYNSLKKFIYNPKISTDSKGTERILEEILSSKKIVANPLLNRNKKISHKKGYLIRKVNNIDINDYVEARNNILNRKYSFNNFKINKLDHYNWWFENKRSSFVLKKDNDIKLYFYQYPILLLNTKYLVSGWFAKNEDCKIQDILYALNWQKKIKKKFLKADAWISAVKDTNLIALKYSNYLGWKKIESTNILYKAINNKFEKKGFSYYFRNIE